MRVYETQQAQVSDSETGKEKKGYDRGMILHEDWKYTISGRIRNEKF